MTDRPPVLFGGSGESEPESESAAELAAPEPPAALDGVTGTPDRTSPDDPGAEVGSPGEAGPVRSPGAGGGPNPAVAMRPSGEAGPVRSPGAGGGPNPRVAMRPSGEAGPVWPPLLGGGAGLRQLEAALAAPVHAYLLVGTVAGDKRAVARAFAGELLGNAAQAELAQAASAQTESAQAELAERHRERARRAVHPDVVLVEPEGRELLAAEATAIITEAARRPLEGAGKVIICDRFHTATPAVAASLLKTVEEPPPGTTIVLLADDVPPGHVTVASRCVTVRFPAPSPEEMCEWVVRSGMPPEVATRAARALGCDPGRAGDLVAAGNLAERLEAWWSIPERLDGTGARVAALVDGLRALIDATPGAASGSAAEMASGVIADPVGSTAPGPGREDSGDPGAGPTVSTGRAERQRSDRRRRRARDTELRFGFAVLAERYRELLDVAAGDRPSSSTATSAPPAGAVAEALTLLGESTAALVRNPDEKLLLQNLLLHLPRLDDIGAR